MTSREDHIHFLYGAGLKTQNFTKNVWAHLHFCHPESLQLCFWKPIFPRMLRPKGQKLVMGIWTSKQVTKTQFSIFLGHYLDQKRLKMGLYRHPWDDITYIMPDHLTDLRPASFE